MIVAPAVFYKLRFSLARTFSLLCKNVTLHAALEQTVASQHNLGGVTFPSSSIIQRQAQCDGVLYVLMQIEVHTSSSPKI